MILWKRTLFRRAMAAKALKSAYEIARDARVLENQAVLKSLELPHVSAGNAQGAATTLSPKTRKRKPVEVPAAEPSRTSRRLRKEGPELGDEAPTSRDEDEAEPTRARPDAASWSSRKAKYEELFRREREEGVELPKRATYEHTVVIILLRQCVTRVCPS
jgi:hypothetical protein